jgi:hypothetical protein
VTGGGGFATFRGTPRAKRRATVRPNTPPRRSPPVVWAEGPFSSGWTAVPGPNRTAHRRSPAHFEVPPPPRRAARAPRPGRGATSRPKHITPSLAASAPASRPTRSSLAAVLTATIPLVFYLRRWRRARRPHRARPTGYEPDGRILSKRINVGHPKHHYYRRPHHSTTPPTPPPTQRTPPIPGTPTSHQRYPRGRSRTPPLRGCASARTFPRLSVCALPRVAYVPDYYNPTTQLHRSTQ